MNWKIISVILALYGAIASTIGIALMTRLKHSRIQTLGFLFYGSGLTCIVTAMCVMSE